MVEMVEIVQPGMSDARLEISLNTQKPIELIDMAISFQALALEYKRHLSDDIQRRGGKVDDADVKLYLTKISKGSVLAEVASSVIVFGQHYPMLDHIAVFAKFIQDIESGIDYFKAVSRNYKSSVPHDPKYTKAVTRRFKNLLDVVQKTDGSYGLRSIEYSDEQTKDGVKIHLTVGFSKEDVGQAMEGILIEEKALEYTGEADHKKVSMYFYQTNTDDPKSSGPTADKAVIKSISEKALKVHFVSDLDQQKIRYILDNKNENPFRLNFVVDVNVEVNRHRIPIFYRVINVHDIIREAEEE